MTPTPPNDPNIPAPQAVDLETPEQKYARLYSAPIPQMAPPVQTPPAPAPMSLPTELTDTLNALRSEMADLRSRQTPPPAPVVVPSGQGWVDKIREGDFKGAEEAMASSIQARLQGEITSKAYADALAATQVQLEIDRHITAVKQANPDIARFERYLQAPVNSRVEAAKAAGRIRSSEDFVREYKLAVDTEVQELRNVSLQYRADGKNEALLRNQQVLSAFTPPPQQVGDHVSTPVPTSQQGESTDDYFARRQAIENRAHNRG